MLKTFYTRLLLPTCAATFILTAQAATTPTPAPAAQPSPNAILTAAVPVPNVPSASTSPTLTPTPPSLGANGYVLMDANTGVILAHKNMHQEMQPASLTKLMTLYLTSQALKNGQIKLTDPVTISKTAWQTGGSRMFVKVGSQVPVQDLIDGIIIASGNDACVALAQYVGGNQASFVNMMNQAAAQLGMKGTHYVDPTGLPQPGHQTTPYDMALLTRAIITQFPQYYSFYKQKWINYNGIKQPNRNRLLWRDPSVDGLKTGHTEEAGYCLISSALRNNMRLIAVVMGAPTDAERASDSQALLNWGFRFYNSHEIFNANQALATPRVWFGQTKTVPVGLTSPLYVTVQRNEDMQLTPKFTLNNAALHAPIKAGQPVGTVDIVAQNKVVASAPLVALAADPEGGLFTRLWDHVAKLV